MSAEQRGYLVGNFTVIDTQLMAEYTQKATPLVQKYGGAIEIMTPQLIPVEGGAQPVFVVIRFPTLKDATDFYEAPDYAPLKELRIKATTGGFLSLVQGTPSQTTRDEASS
ncbi:DUF1330 domain-containing protein [Pseudomonas putida]|uniref:DUF1330 domain-containing protein n=1 Tax=Pseudomonas putida TaxID=303 RepID=UPI00117B8640|nr:DUF1330 domain-containing protein [Pseudomonas putida]TRO38277.1 DUF1330 domain-containing protein [Pseudomonas putida]